MKFIKRLLSFVDVEREFNHQHGVEVTQTFTVAGQGYVINHDLQRQPRGWRIIDKDAKTDLWRLDWDNTTITMAASITPVTVVLEVF